MDFGTEIVGSIYANKEIKNRPTNPSAVSGTNKTHKNQGSFLKLSQTNSFSTNEISKLHKLTFQEIKKIRKSIRMIFHFDQKAHLIDIPKTIKQEMMFDMI